jgi:hypothetical protein
MRWGFHHWNGGVSCTYGSRPRTNVVGGRRPTVRSRGRSWRAERALHAQGLAYSDDFLP